VGYLKGMAEREDRGKLAALRRGLGKPPGTVPEMFPLLVPWTHTLPQYQADLYYLVAALFASHPMAADEGNFGDACAWTHRKIRADRGMSPADDEVDSLERRFVALLNAHADELSEHLRHAVALAAGQEVPINWAQLLSDLRYWDHPDRFIQRRWANSYWGGRREDRQEGKQPAEEAVST